jgi:peptide methionine sulfoxide reductase msrA/msrB
MKIRRILVLLLALAPLSWAPLQLRASSPDLETATFAGGCFWCMQPPFEQLPGVNQVLAGYVGGSGDNPTYGDYAEKGYTEAVQLKFNPATISYAKLLDVYWRQINPTDPEGQFVDRGPQYRAAIYYHTEAQKRLAERSRKALNASGKFDAPIVIKILPVSKFYAAEDYHQDFYKKSPSRYLDYRSGAGRDAFLEQIWGKKAKAYVPESKEQLKRRLSPEQYEVTQEDATEPPFHNDYWNNETEGIYVDLVSGEALFSSKDKFDSGTGWPSFSRPLEPGNLVEKSDGSLGMRRTEVRSRTSNSHLGHVFDDGPAPTHLRYCMNSAAMRFIPKEDLDKEGYGQYSGLFK